MKTLSIITALLSFALYAPQPAGITILDYDTQVMSAKDSIAFLFPPFATTDCEQDELEITYIDATFSGGALGTVERQWLYTDSCGNEATAIQYISLR